MTEFVGVNVLGPETLGTLAEGSSVEPCFAQADIGNGSARVDDYPICEREMVQDDLPRGAITDHVDAMTSDKREFTDKPLQLPDAFVTIIVVRADRDDAG